VIRPGRPTDAAAIHALAAIYGTEMAEAGIEAPPLDNAWRSWLTRRIAAGDVRVAASGEELVGYIIWQARSRPEGRLLVVSDLYVRSHERGNRRGSGLLARALDRARADGLREIELSDGLRDAAASALVRSFGFVAADGRLVWRS
jgi:L-amino acid N-acyltransferase YncA